MFESVVRESLGRGVDFTIAPPEEYVDESTGELLETHPRVVFREGLSVELAPTGLVVHGEDPAIAPLLTFGARLRRIYDLCGCFPWSLDLRDRSVEVTLDVPSSGPAWRGDGLWAKISMKSEDGTVFEDHLLITAEALDDDDFETRRWEYKTRLGELDGVAEVRHEELTFGAPRRLPEDDAYPHLLERLGLTDQDALRARVADALDRAFATLGEVRARYTRIYELPLPTGIAFAAALVQLLGDLPEEPPAAPSSEGTEPGWRRGERWLDAAMSMSPSGLLDGFAPGGLARSTVAVATMFPDRPELHGDGLLDPRLDMRYRRDAPQLVTFMSGNTDGDHWGFWYDAPQFYPRIARNYARDTAETALADEETIPELLRRRVAEETRDAIEQIREEANAGGDSETDGESEEARHAMTQWRTLRVVDVIMTELELAFAGRTVDEEPLCPWPRSDVAPIGSPTLALPPGSGDVPESVPSYASSSDDPSSEELARLIAEARETLGRGEPAFAYALGLYLHWRDGDDLRAEAAALLGDAYRELGFGPFAAILDLHVRYRDLGSVGVFRDA